MAGGSVVGWGGCGCANGPSRHMVHSARHDSEAVARKPPTAVTSKSFPIGRLSAWQA